ncbi:hypothetical protein EV360DRAFT_84856 [Lentinula raphanica]|nr:hypothetical protein EV360DRAFT_84856 [Lentinula raphanica]
MVRPAYYSFKVNTKSQGSRSHIHWEAEDDFDPDATDAVEDLKKHQFLDLHFASAFVKCKLQQSLLSPPGPSASTLVRLFGPDCPDHFESPKPNGVRCQYSGYISFYLFLRSALQFITPLPSFMVDPTSPLSALANLSADSLSKTLMCFFIGHFIWTLLEYIFNRFVDYYLPNKPIFTLTTLAARCASLRADGSAPPYHATSPVCNIRMAYDLSCQQDILFTGREWHKYRGRLLCPLRLHALRVKLYTTAGGFEGNEEIPSRSPVPLPKLQPRRFGVTSKFWDIVFNTVLPV